MRPARCGSALRSAGRRHRAGRWRARARALPRTGHLAGYRPDRPRPRPAGGCGRRYRRRPAPSPTAPCLPRHGRCRGMSCRAWR
ncbi:hypothetical protein G6F31_018411 [Rhizopus arrhizus]|nr:hypothetical protein G6F31_018411 [Rhizopus arrhizus]